MQFAICRPAAHAGDGATDILEENRLRWLKFGNEYFCHTVDPAGTIAWNALDASGLAFKNVAGGAIGTKEQALYVVIQEGRSFQRAYPDVTVLFDKGRHLVVSLDRRRASKIAQHDAHFALRPVTKNEAIVDVVRRPSKPPSVEPRIKKLVDTISRTSFAATLSELASYPTRHSLSGHFQDAAKRTRDRLQLMGYQVHLQDVALPAGKSLNIVADKKGSAGGERSLTLVTAHLDSVNHPADHSQEDPTAPAPGADDNGSGSAGVIEIARIFRDRPITQDLRLILFGGEEQGLCGSKEYLKQLPAAERARIRAVVNMDMIAVLNTTSPIVLLEGGDPVSKDVVAGLSAAAHAYTRLEVNTSWDPHDSDHEPFIRAGLPAVLTIEGGDETNANIHNAKDTLDRINYDLGLEILRMNTAFVADRTGV
jgi:Peptidase family M28